MTTSPDTDNGYVRIANEVLEAMSRLQLAGTEWQVLNVVIRKTWGYNKKTDLISLSQFEKATNLPRRTVTRSLERLTARRILLGTKRSLSITMYGFNKHFLEWKGRDETVPSRDGGVPRGRDETDRGVGTKRSHTKDSLTKDNGISVPNGTLARPTKRSRTTPAAAGLSDTTTKKIPTVPAHLEPLAMYAILFDVKYPSREEWTVFIKRNVRVSTILSKLPREKLAAAMVLAEDHWDKKRDYEVRMETVHKFVENVGREQLSPALTKRRDDLLAAYERDKLKVFLPTPAPTHDAAA